MASSNSTNSYTYGMNLETFSLLWLDEQVNTSEENRQAQQQLRASINYLKTYDDKNRCEQYILSASPQDRIVLIVSGRWGQQLVPDIHHLRQISSIYVYCGNKQTHEQWAENYTKVKSVTTRLDDLITRIKSDQKTRMKVEEPLSINIFSTNGNIDQSTTELNGQFVHFLLLIDVLLRLKSNEKDRQELINLCKNEYKGNKRQLAILHEFERDYSSTGALWWYTRESFLYKMLNKSLRVQNIDVMFLFRFFMNDIYQQLKQYQCESSVRVYRGQIMSDDELRGLRQSIDNFISINSFFSTSTNRQAALVFLHSSEPSNNLNQVLFDIDAHPRAITTKPFADISSYSNHMYESEILFMIGCVFRLTNIYQDDDRIWIIKMELCADDEHDMKRLFENMKEEYEGGQQKVNFRIFGYVLHRMGKYDLAEKIYHRSLTEISSNDPSLSSIYVSLGQVTLDKGEYDSSLVWFHKSLKLKMQNRPAEDTNIRNLYNLLGECYRLKHDYNQALEWYNKAIEFSRKHNEEHHPPMAHIYNNIALVYNKQKRYEEALDFNKKALTIRQNNLPPNHPDIARSHHSIGNVQHNLGHYDLALEHYNESLKIQLKSLPRQHPDIAMIYENIGLVYEAKNKLSEALRYLQNAATIYQHSYASQHPYVVRNQAHIQRVSSKLK